MKIELKNLAPYLPYNLMISSGGKGRPLEMTGNGKSDSSSISFSINEVAVTPYLKPILRPLSDLTIEDSMREDAEHQISTGSRPYRIMLNLFMNHYDVFGLIDQGLAIDINTLNK